MVLSFSLKTLYYMHMHFHMFSTLGIIWGTTHIKIVSQRNHVFKAEVPCLALDSLTLQASICDHTTKPHFPGITTVFFLPFLSEKTEKMQPPMGYNHCSLGTGQP